MKKEREYTVKEYAIGYIRYCIMFVVCVVVVCLIGMVSSCSHSMPVFIPDCFNPCLHY